MVHEKHDDRDEWIIHLRFAESDLLIEDEGHGAIIVVDAVTAAKIQHPLRDDALVLLRKKLFLHGGATRKQQ